MEESKRLNSRILGRGVIHASGRALALAGVAVGVIALTTSAQAAVIFTTSGGSSWGTIDTATHAGTVIGSAGVSAFYGNAYDPTTSTMYGTWGQNKFGTVDRLTGSTTAIGTLPSSGTVWALAINSSGQVYATDTASGNLYTIDKASGFATLVGATGKPNNMDMAFSPGGVLYGTTGGSLFTISTTTGAATTVGSFSGTVETSGYNSIMGLAFDADGRLYATAYEANARLYEINPATAAATYLGRTGLASPHGGDIAPVPEPSQWAMMGVTALGVAGVAVRQYRRKAR